MRAWISVIAVLALAAGGCPSSPQTPVEQATAGMTRILDTLPAGAGTERVGETAWYDAENLHEYLDGMAAFYTDAGFTRLAHSEWHARGSADPAYIELDLYDMGSPLGALEVFADSRSPNSRYVSLGDECQQTAAGLEMRADRYFVRLTARKDVGGQADLVRSLAAAVAKAVGPGSPDTALISPLPTNNLLPHSASYQAKGYMGHDFLQKVRSAAYEQYGRRVDLFVLSAPSPEDASMLLEQWRGVLPPAPIGSPADSDQMTWEEPLVGPMMAARKGRWLVGATGDPSAARSLVDSLLRQLN